MSSPSHRMDGSYPPPLRQRGSRGGISRTSIKLLSMVPAPDFSKHNKLNKTRSSIVIGGRAAPQVPSLSYDDFINSVPVLHRTRIDIFGASEIQIDRSSLKTPNNIRDQIHEIQERARESNIMKQSQMKADEAIRILEQEMAEKEATSKKDKEKKEPSKTVSEKDLYAVKKTNSSFMKSDSERKAQVKAAKMKKRNTEMERLKKEKEDAEIAAALETHIDPAKSALNERMEKEVEELYNKYDSFFGDKSRAELNIKYKDAKRSMEIYSEHELTEAHLTPRSTFLRLSEEQHLSPLPLVLRSDANPLGLFLGNKGLGDKRILPIVEVMEMLPALQTIDLRDNRLTDASLIRFASKLNNLKSLTHLDLSYNKIDHSSKAIMTYLRNPDCILSTLVLNGADVDDKECGNIAKALEGNTSITRLELSHNFIGVDELLNVLHPELITGPEALGKMLAINTTLTYMDVSWNSVKGDSAIALAKALEENSTLKSIDLGYNSFGDVPSQILGKALMRNKGLEYLNIEYNSLTPKAATVLANSISFNDVLLDLNINGNVLGKIGAQALVAAIQRSSTETRKLHVTFTNCDCTKDDTNVFSAAHPHGTWRLNLREPYGQMVAAECLYLANNKAGCRVVRMFYNGNAVQLERRIIAGENESAEAQKKRNMMEEFVKHSRDAAKELLDQNFEAASRYLMYIFDLFDLRMSEENRALTVQKVHDLWMIKAQKEGRDDLPEVFLYEVFFALFVINDVDYSGTMELDEFMETLCSLGKEFDRDAAMRLMAEHDRDESGSIDANEFGQIMLKEFCITDIPRGDIVDVSTGKPWEIPQTGNCNIQLSYMCDAPTLYDVGADYGIDNIIQSIRDAKTDDQREVLFQNTTSSPYFFLSFEQAQVLFEEMEGLNRMPLDLMAFILPQIVNDDHCVKFIDTNLNDIGKLALRVKVGQLYNSYVGLHTGHYTLDLRKIDQRNGGRRLGAVSVSESKGCRASGCNSSQKGNYSNFRNEKLGYTPVDITGRWFASAGSSGILKFDYISTQKPKKNIGAIQDNRLNSIIDKLQLEEIKKIWDEMILKRMTHDREFEESIEEYNTEYGHLMGKSADLHTLPPIPVKVPWVDRMSDYPALKLYITFAEEPFTQGVIENAYADFLDTCHHFYDILPEERMRDVSRPGYNPNIRPPTPEAMKLAPAPKRDSINPLYMLCYRRLLELQIMMPNIYLSVEQVIRLMDFFPPEICYLRIHIIMSVFNHIVDQENLYMLLDDHLSEDEQTELIHRVGIMNLIDPMKPDRIYRLDLRVNDHREMAKVLSILALVEPGDNWVDLNYRWSKFDPAVPGWVMPSSWGSHFDDGGSMGGPKTFGRLTVRYKSKGDGCKPVWGCRKHLRKRTLAGMKRLI